MVCLCECCTEQCSSVAFRYVLLYAVARGREGLSKGLSELEQD